MFLTPGSKSRLNIVSQRRLIRPQRLVTAVPFIIAQDDSIILLNISSGTPSIAMPAAASRRGQPITFKDLGQAAAHNVTFTFSGTEKVDGLSTWLFNINFQTVTFLPFKEGLGSGYSAL